MNSSNGARPRERPATIYDVAQKAGVSAQTVSRLMKGFEGIRPVTRLRVEEAIAALGYRPNRAAQVLRTRKSMQIGAIVHDMFEFGPARLLRGAARRARLNGYTLTIIGVDSEDQSSVDKALAAFEDHQVAGILAITLTDSVHAVVDSRPIGVPILIDPAEAEVGGVPANIAGGHAIANYFADLGHRQVGLVRGPANWLPARQRHSGFLSQAECRGLACVDQWTGDWSAASGFAAAAQFPAGGRTTAVFAANDAMAIGFMRGLASRGVHVPHDVSVAGFDDQPEAAFATPSLTTIRAEFELQGALAIDLLLGQIEQRAVGPTQHPPAAVSVRDSTAAPSPNPGPTRRDRRADNLMETA